MNEWKFSLNMAVNVQVLWKAGNFLTSGTAVNF
jgi:hypothetical protein